MCMYIVLQDTLVIKQEEYSLWNLCAFAGLHSRRCTVVAALLESHRQKTVQRKDLKTNSENLKTNSEIVPNSHKQQFHNLNGIVHFT